METNIEEIWKHVPEYPRFKVSNTGKVYDCLKSEEINQKFTAKYLWVRLPDLHHSKGTWMVHRLVIYVFTGIFTSRKRQCNHKDGNKLNNNLSNLEVVTPSENLLHAYRMGLHKGAWSKTSHTDDYKKWKETYG